MGQILLITGGSRSGKSGFAQRCGESYSGKRIFVATSPRLDPEMENRINAHIEDRKGGGWITIEEEKDLSSVFTDINGPALILVDCLTLWINNLMYQAICREESFTEEQIQTRAETLLSLCRTLPHTFLFVTNEVGWGIVPENRQARQYRDLVGRCNQVVAGFADSVVLVTCGIPTTLKGDLTDFPFAPT